MKPGGTSRFIGFCAVLAAVSLLPGCGPTTSRKGIVAYDFIESFPLSESRHEVTFIDFGTPTARPHLRSGWSTDEGSGNASWVWSLGRESVLEFFLHEPRELPVTFRCFPFQFPGSPPQRISIAVNGVDLQTVRLLDGSKPYQIILPAVALKTGKNQLQFRYAYSRSAIAVMPDSVGQRILSKVTLQVSQAIPSYLAGREYQFRMVGGELNGKRLHIAGFPRFQVGQDVVLFLNSRPADVFGPTVGLWQGVFFVERDAATGKQTVTDYQHRPILDVRDYRFVVGLPRTGKQQAAVAAGSSPSGLAIDQFFDRIRTLRFSPSSR